MLNLSAQAVTLQPDGRGAPDPLLVGGKSDEEHGKCSQSLLEGGGNP